MPHLVARFLRETRTNRWLTESGRLSHLECEACPFASTVLAFERCRELQLCGMELVLKFDISAYDVSLPIPDFVPER